MNHALLAPSSASRWLACTPSARLESLLSDTESEAAREGTLAHKLSELLINYKLHNIQFPYHNTEMAKIESDPLYSISMHAYCDEYAAYIIERYNAAKARTADAQIYLETKLDMSEYVPEGYGTGDVLIGADYALEFIDLKYGKGVPIYAKDNKQMMTYAIGAIRKLGFLFDIKVIRMTIYQPRLDSISTWEISVNDLMQWAKLVLKPRAELAFKGEGEFVAGMHCQFCKLKGKCKALATYNLEISKVQFPDANDVRFLNDVEIANVLFKQKMFIDWIGAVKDYALEQAMKGKKFPGWKLVKGRSDRMYTDADKVGSILMAEPDLTKMHVYKPETVRGITEIQKLLGEARMNRLLSAYIIKPDGKPTLAIIEDSRPEINSVENAKEDFANV